MSKKITRRKKKCRNYGQVYFDTVKLRFWVWDCHKWIPLRDFYEPHPPSYPPPGCPK